MSKTTNPRPLLVGESNPYGGDDAFALYPAPVGCSGHRLCCLILGMYRHDYLGAFARVDLVRGKWSMKAARVRAQELFSWNAPVILLGAKVAAAWEIEPFKPFTTHDDGKTLSLPHPSGLCRTWQLAGAFARARAAVAALCPEIAELIGRADR